MVEPFLVLINVIIDARYLLDGADRGDEFGVVSVLDDGALRRRVQMYFASQAVDDRKARRALFGGLFSATAPGEKARDKRR